MDAKQLVDAAMALDAMTDLPRTGWVMRGVAGAETLAAHSFGVAWVAALLVDALRADGHTIDGEKVLHMALVHDAPEAVRDAIARLLTKSSAISLSSVKARQKDLQKRLKRFGATEDPNAVWKGMGVRNIEAASLASGPEFAALAKRGK